MELEELEKKIDDNAEKIIANMNKLHSHEEKIEVNSKRIKENSFAMELLHQSKKTNQRLFIVWLVTLIAFIGLLGYTIYLLNDIGVETTTQEVTQENTDGTNNFVGNDGDIINGKAENKAN